MTEYPGGEEKQNPSSWDSLIKKEVKNMNKETKVIDLTKDGEELTEEEKKAVLKYKNKHVDRMVRKSDMKVK